MFEVYIKINTETLGFKPDKYLELARVLHRTASIIEQSKVVPTINWDRKGVIAGHVTIVASRRRKRRGVATARR